MKHTLVQIAILSIAFMSPMICAGQSDSATNPPAAITIDSQTAIVDTAARLLRYYADQYGGAVTDHLRSDDYNDTTNYYLYQPTDIPEQVSSEMKPDFSRLHLPEQVAPWFLRIDDLIAAVSSNPTDWKSAGQLAMVLNILSTIATSGSGNKLFAIEDNANAPPIFSARYVFATYKLLQASELSSKISLQMPTTFPNQEAFLSAYVNAIFSISIKTYLDIAQHALTDANTALSEAASITLASDHMSWNSQVGAITINAEQGPLLTVDGKPIYGHSYIAGQQTNYVIDSDKWYFKDIVRR